MHAPSVLAYGQLTLLGTLSSVPETAWETPGVCGDWSVKDVVAHLASYEVLLVDILASVSGDGPTPCLDRFLTPGAPFNDDEVAARRGRSRTEVMAELTETHARTLEMIAAIPAETIARPGTLTWYGAEYALDDMIVYMYYGHKREHSAQIAVFCDRVTI